MKKWVYIALALLCVALIVLGVGYFRAKGNAASLNDAVQQLSATVETRTAELEALNGISAENEALSADLAGKDAELEALSADAAEAAAQLEALNAELAGKDAELEALSADAAEAAAQLEALNAELAEKDAELEALSAELAGKDAKLEALSADVADKTAQLEALSSNLAGKDTEIEALNAGVAGKSSEIETLNADLQGKTTEIETLNADLQGKATEIETLNADLAGKDAEIEALNADVAGKDAQIAALSVPPVWALDADELSRVEEGSFRNTKRFLLALQAEGVPYTVESTEEGDVVSFVRNSKSKDAIHFSYTVRVLFPPENDSARILVPKLIDYSSSGAYCVYLICDEVNSAWHWVKFFTDRSDTTVTAEYDCVLVDAPEAGEYVHLAA